VRLAVARLARRLRAEHATGAAGGPSPSGLSALASLHQAGPLSMSALACRENLTGPSTTRVITSLEATGYARRRPDPHDNRRVLAELTPAGRACLDNELAAGETWLATRLAELSPTDRDLLDRASAILTRLATTVGMGSPVGSRPSRREAARTAQSAPPKDPTHS
jgi:DNA-binding MarR family transcriptional regulator